MTFLLPAHFRAASRPASMRRCQRHGFASRLVMAGVDACIALQLHARVAELADAPDLGSGG